MPLDRDAVLTALRGCRDPEIPVNVVDLGLVYGVELAERDGAVDVGVRMTLTSPGCPMSHSIAAEVRRRVAELPGVRTVEVELVWEPAWHPGLITVEGRRQLQLAG